MAIILGIETSCDETALALYCGDNGLLAHEVYSQIDLHKQYGGVVPELASRDHVVKITPLLDKIIHDSGIKLCDIDAVAYTAGPGLAGALMVGSGFATSLAMALNIPLIPVHHLEAHITVAMLDNNELSFPYLALLVSGGHTQILYASSFGSYEVLGDTLDDAIGEAFDKSAKIMGLPYPGGREISMLSEKGDPNNFTFPRPLLKRPGCDFSFSGLKTSVANAWYSSDKTDKTKADISASFQIAVVECCIDRLKNAIDETKCTNIVVAGGVAANKYLRLKLGDLAEELDCNVLFPDLKYCTDNGAMIAFTGYLKFINGDYSSDYVMSVMPRWPLANTA
jgi:N6-L-threonylcarbamoyladenine synthase